jgi:hypothetical protein
MHGLTPDRARRAPKSAARSPVSCLSDTDDRPPEKWDVCRSRPGGRLVAFLWGTPKVFGASRNWSFRDLGLQLPRQVHGRARVVGQQLIARLPSSLDLLGRGRVYGVEYRDALATRTNLVHAPRRGASDDHRGSARHWDARERSEPVSDNQKKEKIT